MGQLINLAKINFAGGGSGDIIDALLNGTLIPALAANLEPWADQDDLTVSTQWNEAIRTTGGSAMLITDKGGRLLRIIPQTDFKCSGLRTSGYNQLRLVADGGCAKEIATGVYIIPVPKLTFGEYGSAKENNGMLFTSRTGENLTPTVRFQPWASGEPTSASDGTLLAAQSNLDTANANGGIYTDHDLDFYLTSGPGWLIVTGITYADTCAHIAWEDWYDKFVAPDDADDAGDYVNLAPLFPHFEGSKMRIITTGARTVADGGEWTGEDTCQWTKRVLASTPAAWDRTVDDVPEGSPQTYTFSADLGSTFAADGLARLADGTLLNVSGTTVSITKEVDAAPTGEVYYQAAAESTGTETIDQAYALNDCGIEMLEGVEGAAFLTTLYARNIADALAEIAAHNLDELTRVIAEALCSLYYRLVAMEDGKGRYDSVKASVVDATELTAYDIPRELWCAGAPSASVVPDNWPAGVPWDGFPAFRGQIYNDTTNKKTYKAFNNTAISDWVVFN